MPKITWCSKKKPKINYLHALFREYMLRQNITSTTLAQTLGCSPPNVRVWINKPASEWTFGKMKAYCDALKIPYSEAYEAAMK